MHVVDTTAREEKLGETHVSCLLPHLAPPTSQHPSYVTVHPNAYAWVGCACWVTWLCSDFFLGFLWFYVNFHLLEPENHVYLILRWKKNIFFNICYFSKTHKSETAQTKHTYKEKALYVL